MMPDLKTSLPKPQVTTYQAIKFCLVCALFFCVLPVFAQDMIYTTKGDQIKCKVVEIGDDSVSYHNPAASALKSMVKTDVFVIKYGNGWADTITAKHSAAVAKNTDKPAAIITSPSSLPDALIFTTDGRQIACKVAEIDDTDGISYLLAGNTVAQKSILNRL